MKCEGISGVPNGWAGRDPATLISTLAFIYVNLILSFSVFLSLFFHLSLPRTQAEERPNPSPMVSDKKINCVCVKPCPISIFQRKAICGTVTAAQCDSITAN